MTGNTELGPFFHGTEVKSAEDLRTYGINENMFNRRDRGFYGEAFYMTTRRENAEMHASAVADQRDKNPEVLRLEFSDDVSVFRPAKEYDDMKPAEPPEYHDEFIDWLIDVFDEAAVWEKIPGKSRDDIVPSGVNQRTPGHDEFDAEKWWSDVTQFGKEQGYDIVWWNPTEVLVVNTDAPTEIK